MPVRSLRVIVNLGVVAFFALMLDGFVNRDPYVRLPNGYAIVAISGGSPCGLMYERDKDSRPHSDWTSLRSVVQDSSGRQSMTYTLLSRAACQALEYPSESEWRAAIREKNAVPPQLSAGACSGITRFGQRGSVVFGDCDKGYFLLSTELDEYQILRSQDEWARQVAAKTGASPGEMKDPKSWVVRTRDAFSLTVVGGFMLITLPWVFAPVWRRHRGGCEIQDEAAG